MDTDDGMATAENRCVLGRLFPDGQCGGKIHASSGLCEWCSRGIAQVEVPIDRKRFPRSNTQCQVNVGRPGRSSYTDRIGFQGNM